MEIAWMIKEGMLTEELYDYRPGSDQPCQIPFSERHPFPVLDIPESFTTDDMLRLPFSGIPLFRQWNIPKNRQSQVAWSWSDMYDSVVSKAGSDISTAAAVVLLMDRVNTMIDMFKVIRDWMKELSNEI
jgi:hypothetical protein